MNVQTDADESVTTFPYETDNVYKALDHFTLSKVFDNYERDYRSPDDKEVDDLDIRVNFKFSVRETAHNSALNSDFISALEKKDP